MKRICLYFKQAPEQDRWLPGDRFVRPLIRRIVRGKPKFVSGVNRIFLNLREGLDRLGVRYELNLPFGKLRDEDRVGVMGRGPFALTGYDRPNPIVAGPYLMTHASEWPDLCEKYPVAKYLQHCDWANEMYQPYYGDRCTVWPHGVDIRKWAPSAGKDIDVLIYDKVRWERQHFEPHLIEPLRAALRQRGLKFVEIRYGAHTEQDYRDLLVRSRAMIFLVEHESQGSAVQECLACDVPMLAWEQGRLLDPNLVKWGQPKTIVSSAPYFDARCGEKFVGSDDFAAKLDLFWSRLRAGQLRPREFVLEHLTLEKCAQDYLRILEEAWTLGRHR